MAESLLEQRASFARMDQGSAEDWAIIGAHNGAFATGLADRVLAHLALLKEDSGGFAVDRFEHSLQTAARAENDGRDEEYVLCALLHDIGDTLAPYTHPAIAAGIVKPFVSPANHWMVEHHGIFQGYYFWHHIGMDRNTRDQFSGHEYYEYTEEFCAKYDQAAFDPAYTSPDLAHYEPLIRKFFVPGS